MSPAVRTSESAKCGCLLPTRYGRKGENVARYEAEASDGSFSKQVNVTRDFDLKFSSSINHLLTQDAVLVMLTNLQRERFSTAKVGPPSQLPFQSFFPARNDVTNPPVARGTSQICSIRSLQKHASATRRLKSS